MEKYLILLSPSLSQDLFGNNTISPPWQLFATSPVCFWHRHLHPPEKLHHKLYTFTFWSFFQNMFFVFTNIYTCLRNCTKTVHLHFFTIFFCKTCPLFTKIYTCLKNCTTNCTPSLFAKHVLCSSYKDLHLPDLPSGISANCDLVILFAKAWLICVSRVLKCLWNWVECVLTRLAQNIFPLGTEQLIFKQGQHRAIPKQTDIPY